MGRGNFPLQTFNRGRISRLGLARTDLDRARVSAEVQKNWVPRTIGSMMVRPGLIYVGGTKDNSASRLIPFVRSSTDTAMIEVSSGTMRVWASDALITRVNSTAVYTNGDFNSSTTLLNWTDADESGADSTWITGDYMGLTGTKFATARRRQTTTSSSGEHSVAVTVERGRPMIKIGSSNAGQDYLEETALRPGNYSFKITSTGNFVTEFFANTQYTSLVTSVAVESSGTMEVSVPYASTDLDNLRWEQSGDVIFVACEGLQQRRIERQARESWASVVYDPEDGPFRTINITGTRLNPTALSGNVTVEADQALFNSSQVGGLLEITSVGQNVENTVTGADQWSDAIRVSGVAENRVFDITLDNFSTDITTRVQRSVGEEGNWGNVSGLSWTSSTATVFDDGLDNQIVFYRIGSGTTDYNSTAFGTVDTELNYASGGITGVARITSVPSATESSAIVLSPFGSTGKSELWAEGAWSGSRGFPSAVTLHEGRLCWAGRAKFWGSVSDAFESFDNDVEGDSGPLDKAIGAGPTDKMEWMLSMTRLVMATQGNIFQAKTSSLEEPLTPTNFSFRDVATQGAGNVQGVKIDKASYFVQQGGTRVYEVGINQASLEYDAIDRTILVPEIGEPNIVRMDTQRQPDTRLHCIRGDGTAGMMIRDPAEDVLCWIDVASTAAAGIIEEVAVLPSTSFEDAVYYVVKREVNGSTVRHIERWATEPEARGDSTNRMADAGVRFDSASATTAVTGADHLVGETVTIWANTKDLGTATVSSTGTFDCPEQSTSIYYGLDYEVPFRSAKLAYASEGGTALTQRKKVDRIGLILADAHAQGLQYGQSSTGLYYPPLRETGSATTNTIYTAYDEQSFQFDGSWDTDSRFELWGKPPRPCTVLAAVMTIDERDKN